MANNPEPMLKFRKGCPDCGARQADLPGALPSPGDDFDWLVRDYDGFRLFMMEELAARFPERTRWSPADVEVAVIEVLATVLDQLSDTLDRVAGEAFLDTAKRPESVRRLLKMVGFDPLAVAKQLGKTPFDRETTEQDQRSDEERFDQYWLDNPHLMETAKVAGPRTIHDQHRMVTIADHGQRLEDHPLVERASAWQDWCGSWLVIRIAVISWQGAALDQLGLDYGDRRGAVDSFHAEHGISPIRWNAQGDPAPTLRTILRTMVDDLRMAGQEVLLEDAIPIGINMSLSIQVDENYYQFEVQHSVKQALGTLAGGFFEPGRMQFGEDLHASDLFETLMKLDGVKTVCLNRFKRLGSHHLDRSDAGVIELHGLEIAVCDNDPAQPERGYFLLYMHGGRKG